MKPSDPPERAPERLVDNLREVRSRIAAAAGRGGRSSDDVTLVVVTKSVSSRVVALLPGLGITDVGENRVQQALERHSVAPGLRWHMIGHLQRNKARRAVGLFSLIHSIDSVRLLGHLDRIAAEEGREVRGLLQLNISGEGQKHGLDPDELPAALAEASDLEHVEIAGLMGMAAWSDDPEDARPAFRSLREARDEAERRGWYRGPLSELSMGMTGDFETAVEEGATIVRIGTAIFESVSEEL